MLKMNKPCLKNSNCKTSSCLPWSKTPNRMWQHWWGLSLGVCQESNLLPTLKQGNVSVRWLLIASEAVWILFVLFLKMNGELATVISWSLKKKQFIHFLPSLSAVCILASSRREMSYIYILPFLGNMVLTLSNSSQRYPSWIPESNKILSKSHTRINSSSVIPSYCWHFSGPEKRVSCFTNENSGYFWNVFHSVVRFYINIITKQTFLHT